MTDLYDVKLWSTKMTALAPFQYNLKFETNNSYIVALTRFIKNFMKKTSFLITNFQHITQFEDLRVFVTNITAASISHKFQQESLFYCCFQEALVKNLMKKAVNF